MKFYLKTFGKHVFFWALVMLVFVGGIYYISWETPVVTSSDMWLIARCVSIFAVLTYIADVTTDFSRCK